MLKFEETTPQDDFMSFGSFDTLNASTDGPKVTTKDVIREDMSDEVNVKYYEEKKKNKLVSTTTQESFAPKKQEVQSQLDRDKVKTELQEKLLQWSGDVNKGTLKIFVHCSRQWIPCCGKVQMETSYLGRLCASFKNKDQVL